MKLLKIFSFCTSMREISGDLRRSATTNWAQKLPIQVVQQPAGHADISTTQKYYLAVRPDDLASAGRILKSIATAQGND